MVPQWASKWRQLGTQLNIDQHLMDNIEHDHPSDWESCCSKMFSKWLDINPAASWDDIVTAVDNLTITGGTFARYRVLSCGSYYLHSNAIYLENFKGYIQGFLGL